MTLHGDLKVNGHVIMTWQVQNMGRIVREESTREMCRYDCTIFDELTRTSRKFDVVHNREQGAARLAAAVLQRYYVLQRVAPLEGDDAE